MRVSSSNSKTQMLPAQISQRIETFAVYAALALIAAVVFGTLSIRPF